MIDCRGHRAGACVVAGGCLLLVVWMLANVRQRDCPMPDHCELRQGLEAMRSRRYAEAAQKFEASGSPLALGWLAECRYLLNEDTAALAVCDRLGKADPRDGRSHYVRGLVYLRMGHADEARQELQTAARKGEALAATVLGD
jgi:tetratricopeptide (TPR) repeat protein